MSHKLFAICFLFFLGSNAFCQSNQSKPHEIILGLSSPLLNNGIGLELGWQKTLWQHENIGIKGQLLHNQYKVTHAFLSGNTYSGSTSHLMAGPFLTFFKNSKLKPTLMALVGPQLLYDNEMINNKNLEFIGGVALSASINLTAKIKASIFVHSPDFGGLNFAFSF